MPGYERVPDWENVERRTARQIEGGPEFKPELEPPNPCDELMHILETDPEAADLNARLDDTFENRRSICTWLLREDRDLQWRKPATFVRIGDYKTVDSALESLDSGVYT
jgi:hypothetical protein